MIRLIDYVSLLHATVLLVPHANVQIKSLKSQALNTLHHYKRYNQLYFRDVVGMGASSKKILGEKAH